MRPQTAGPSARLFVQLDECMRIKAAFARKGLPCPAAAVERALLLPEDRPEPHCRSALPSYKLAPPPVTKGGGKKGKGGAKKGKKAKR